MAARHRPHDLPGTIVAMAFVLLGILLITESRGMSEMGSVFPTTISIALIAFSAILVVRNVAIGLRRPEGAEPAPPSGLGPLYAQSTSRRLGFVLAMGAWVVLIPVLGFFVASVLAFFAVMGITVRERVSVRRVAALCLTGLVIVAGFYLVMMEVLLIPMPRGLLF